MGGSVGTQTDREIELSQTNRGTGGMYVGVVPRIRSKLSRVFHAHRGKKLLQGLETLESVAMKRAMVRFRGVREKGAMAFVEILWVSQEDTMEGPLWRETLGRSLGSHDLAELVGRNHPPLHHILHKHRIELSHSQSGAPPGTGSIPSRE